MARNVFWSWQSDAPQRETRDVIAHALKGACEELAAELEEADRIEIDQGSKDVVGEVIAETILNKIDNAFAFVGDISTIAVSGEGIGRKCVPNPNVMLELGYARKSLGSARVIPVFNRSIEQTRFEDLPFDLRHLSGSIAFDLPKDATTDILRRERTSLQKRLVERLRALLETQAPEPSGPTAEWHAHLSHDPSIWEEAYSPLPVNCPNAGQLDVIVAPAPRIYVQLLPFAQGASPKSSGGLYPNHQDPIVPIGFSSYITHGRTGNGYAAFENLGDDRMTRSIARWYKDTGEIWAISAWSFYLRDEHPQFAYDEVIRGLVQWLQHMVRSSRAAGGLGSLRVRLGATGLRKVKWFVARPSPGSNPFFGLNDIVQGESVLVDDARATIITAVTNFMELLTDNFAQPALSEQQVETLAGG